jgi:hypothetical protein
VREGLPVVVGVVERVTKTTVLIRAACPYCDRWHQHGHPDAPHPNAGSRVADCGGGSYFVAVQPVVLALCPSAARPKDDRR